jgi:hypothetical protein
MLAICLLAAACFAVSAFGHCEWYDSPIDCQIYLENQQYLRQKAEEAGKAKADFIESIAKARAQFWATYPNKSGAAQASQQFADLLWQKDIYFLELALRSPQSKDLTDRRGPGFLANVQDLMVGLQTTDGGIRRSASPEFFDWVAAVRKGFGPEPKNFDDVFTQSFQIGLMGETFWKAVAASQKEYKKYVLERDFWEFDDVKRIPAGCDKPQTYGAYLYFRFGKVPTAAAPTTYAQMLQLLGTKAIGEAAKQVMAAPKTPDGNLVVTTPDPVTKTPSGNVVPDDTVPEPDYVIGAFRGPLSAFEALATRGDDRRYLFDLLADNIPVPNSQSRHIDKWKYAGEAYRRYVAAFGEPAVLQASHLVRTATKRMTTSGVMDPKAIGATRSDRYSAFEDVLVRKDPRGYVRSLLAFTQRLDSAPAVDAAYKQFVSERNENAVLDAAKKMAAGKPEPTYMGDLKTLESVLNGSLSLDKPPEVLVDFPLYLAWKKFPPGAKVTYVDRGLQPIRPGSNQLVAGQVKFRKSFRMDAINDEQAHLWLTETVYDYPSGAAHQPRDTEIVYPAKFAPRATRTAPPATTPTGSGEETLEIGGKRIATHWQSVSSPFGNSTKVTKTWTSDQIPTGLVRETVEYDWQGSHLIGETIIESVEGTGFNIATAPQGPPVIQPAPAAAPETSPSPSTVPSRQPPVPVRTPPTRGVSPRIPSPAASVQDGLVHRYSSVMARVGRARGELARSERTRLTQHTQLPADVRDASDRLNPEMKEAVVAFQTRDPDLEQKLQSLEDSVGVIEKYLGK